MAELMGTVSAAMGIASFAVQVVDSALKLKQLLDDIKGAPEEIAFMVDKIERQKQILEEIKFCTSKGVSYVNTSVSERCIAYCEKLGKDLSVAVEDLEIEKKRNSKWRRGGKFILKKESLQKLQSRLDSGHDILLQAQLSYNNALVRHQTAMMEKQMAFFDSLMFNNVMNGPPAPRVQIQGTTHHLQATLPLMLDPKASISTPRIQIEDSKAYLQGPQSPVSGPKVLLPSASVTSFSSETDYDEIIYGNLENQEDRSWETMPVYKVYSSTRNSWLDYLMGAVDYEKIQHKPRRAPRSNRKMVEERTGYVARLRVPAWISQRAWGVYAKQAQSGWDFKLRTHKVVPSTFAAWNMIRIGDVMALRKMFENKEASPFDLLQDDNRSYLHVAAQHNQMEVCRLLIEYGADVNATFQTWVTPLHEALFMATGFRTDDNTFSIDMLNILLQNEDFDALELLAPSSEQVVSSNKAPKVQLYLQSLVCPSYGGLSLRERFEYTVQEQWPCIESIRIGMGGGEIPPEAFMLQNFNGKTLMHSIAENSLEAFDCPNDQFVVAECHRLFKEAIQAGADLWAFTLGQDAERNINTPLIELLKTYGHQYYYVRRHPGERLTFPWKPSKLYEVGDLVRFWASQLLAAGLSGDELMEYGRAENLFYQSELVDREFAIELNFFSRKKELRYIRVIGIKYGPSFKDWGIWTSNPNDEWAGEFWEFVEKPEPHVPGAWIDA